MGYPARRRQESSPGPVPADDRGRPQPTSRSPCPRLTSVKCSSESFNRWSLVVRFRQLDIGDRAAPDCALVAISSRSFFRAAT
jgi:hypothetical protein